MKYTVGVDFGTLSARALVVRLSDGAEVGTDICEYPNAVMSEKLPDGTPITDKDAAFQVPADYLFSIGKAVKGAVEKAGIKKEEVVGVGIDFTACTVLPTKADGTPLCELPEFSSSPSAYVKLWKHHSAEEEAAHITAVAEERGEKWLSSYGGKVSSEWMLPKIYETLLKAPEVYAAAERFSEAAEWVTRMLTDKEVTSSCFAGFKALWNDVEGYPSDEFMKSVDPRLSGIVGTKINPVVSPCGSLAGRLSKSGAELLGLVEGTAVSVPIIDAHSSLPAAGVVSDGGLMMMIGTSTCEILLSGEKREMTGICGVVKDGVVPGLYAYEAGQAAVGDSFAWYMENCLPKEYHDEAEARGMNAYALMREKASALTPAKSGLLAIDWQNGCRSPLADYSLSGLIMGMTLLTRPEEIYLALVEATAFGCRRIVDNFVSAGVPVKEIFASGGIAEKDSFIMQIYADVLGREIKVSASPQAGALGSAMTAAVACGEFTDLKSASRVLSKPASKTYAPRSAQTVADYDRLYAEYVALTDCFAENGMMGRLKQLKAAVKH